jgi:hypothetical protein
MQAFFYFSHLFSGIRQISEFANKVFVNNLVETNFIKNFIKSLPIFEGFLLEKNEKLRLHFLFCAFTINFIKTIL